jgi:8-oxo-dGTP pyrophosphatase MutT (NUDIX family)
MKTPKEMTKVTYSHTPNLLYYGFNKLSSIVRGFCKLFKIKYREIWVSRSAAVVAVILAIHKDNIFVLAEKRSEKMDEPGKWCVPCGYLDWGETGYQAVKREAYEEIRFNVDKYKEHIITNNEEQPFFVNTEPSENRQNVSLSYCLVYNFEGHNLPKLVLSDEVLMAKWIPIEHINGYNWAFAHDERIKMAIEKFKDNLQ